MEAVVRTLEREHFDELLLGLRERGYEVIGPVVRSGAIGTEPVASSADLPVGITEEQEGGTYRLRDRGDRALFGFSTGPQAWKRWLHPPVINVWSAERDPERGGLTIRSEQEEDPPRLALLGVRSCDLHAIRSLDDALLRVEHPDPTYRARRERAFIVALNCSTPGGTCFCVSTQTGPRADFGFDLALTEVMEDDRHYFVCEPGTEAGRELLEALPTAVAGSSQRAAADDVVERAAASMGRQLETDGLAELLGRNLEHPRWEEVSQRCLTCGNCTQVCPTCFCTDVEDLASLDGLASERNRHWDSCFTLGFTYVHGGSVRTSAKSRYRQWMTHKLSTWMDQFDHSVGCVGCGRCISWCPVAIDITEEAAAIRATDGAVS